MPPAPAPVRYLTLTLLVVFSVFLKRPRPFSTRAVSRMPDALAAMLIDLLVGAGLPVVVRVLEDEGFPGAALVAAQVPLLAAALPVPVASIAL